MLNKGTFTTEYVKYIPFPLFLTLSNLLNYHLFTPIILTFNSLFICFSVT